MNSITGPPSYNIKNAVDALGNEELYERIRELKSDKHCYRLFHLNGMEGPDSGYIRLTYTPVVLHEEDFAEKVKDQTIRLFASRISTYADREELNTLNPQNRSVYLEYHFG